MDPINLISNNRERFSYIHAENFLLGRGAMGEVYRGWRTGHPERKVAIKLVHKRHAENPAIRERARYEASLFIKHPNIIQMLGYCEQDRARGPIYIVSELIQGVTIDKFVKSIPLSERTDSVSRMMMSALDALICLHNQRIWHRDVKPSNIMVEGGRNVRLMDLGIAISDGISFGTIEKGFGTYPYASPEQITGQRNEVDNLSDIYSLGISFYELLTDTNPFKGGSDVDILEKQIKMSLPYNKAIPTPLFKVLQKATAKKKADRYQSAEAFKEAIDKAVFQEPDDGSKRYIWYIIIGVSMIALITLIIAISKHI